jgi:hypothetical protein
MSNIFYFPRYSQKENFITNNTLLLLYRLYGEDRFRFQKFLKHILKEKNDASIDDVEKVGLQIRQQVGIGQGVQDGYLYQEALHIGIETKRAAKDFRSDQLIRHVSAFQKEGGGFQILLSPTVVDLKHPSWTQLRSLAESKNVSLASITFEQIINSFRACLKPHDEEMHNLIDDFEEYCSSENLLDADRRMLFVPPCGKSFDINIEYNLYFCPSNWTRRSTRYLGIYKERAVHYIGEISQIIHVEQEDENVLHFFNGAREPININEEIKNRILNASRSARTSRDWNIMNGHKFFICTNMQATNFIESTPNGIMGHRYFDLGKYMTDFSNAEAVAKNLNGIHWKIPAGNEA